MHWLVLRLTLLYPLLVCACNWVLWGRLEIIFMCLLMGDSVRVFVVSFMSMFFLFLLFILMHMCFFVFRLDIMFRFINFVDVYLL